MGTMKKITLRDRVEKALKEKPRTRDYDWELVMTILEEEAQMSLAFFNGYNLILKIQSQEFSNPETILRWRRRIQQLNPDLRGRFWKQRMAKIDDYLEQLGYKHSDGETEEN